MISTAGSDVVRVIISVMLAGHRTERDLEVPATVPSAKLAALIMRALDGAMPPTAYVIESHPPGRRLDPTESLADAGAWDGARVLLHQVAVGADVSSASLPPAGDGPLRGWRPLNLKLPGYE